MHHAMHTLYAPGNKMSDVKRAYRATFIYVHMQVVDAEKQKETAPTCSFANTCTIAFVHFHKCLSIEISLFHMLPQKGPLVANVYSTSVKI